MNSIFFSIIIPTRNEEVNLPILLNALTKQTDKDFEIIISDKNSTDQTTAIVKKYQTKFAAISFYQKNFKNVSQARNFGASKSKGKYLIFFDADVEPEKNFIKEIKEKIIKNRLGAATVWNRAKKDWKNKLIFGLMNLLLSFFQKIKPAANGPCMIINKEIFEKIGGFDEEIVFGEDFELIQRIVKKTKTKFAVFARPVLFVSTRRLEKEGAILTLYKSIKAIIYQLVFGPIKKPIFQYKMGGDYYRQKKSGKI